MQDTGNLHSIVVLDTPDRRAMSEVTPYSLMADAIVDDAIYLLDPCGQVISWNQGAEQIFGYGKEEILGQQGSIFYPADPAVDASQGEQVAVAGNGRQERQQWCIRKDGQRFWASTTSIPLRSSAGVLPGIGTVVRDLTEQVHLREQLEATQTHLHAHQEQLQLGIDLAKLALAEVDYKKHTVNLTCEAAHMFGLGEQAATVSRTIVQRTIHPLDLSEVKRQTAIALDPNGPGWYDLQLRVVCPDGGIRWLHARSKTHFEGEGRDRQAIRGTVVLLDITDAKRADLEAKHNEKRFRQLAGGIAHDFNNLLTIVIGHAAMLADSTTSSTDLEHTHAIREAAQTAGAITKQLLTLSGKHVMVPEVIDVNHWVSHLIVMTAPALGPLIKVVTELVPDAGKVKINGAQFNQIVLNLLLNARDAMPRGGLIHVSTAKITRTIVDMDRSTVRSFVRVQLKDSGPGISPDVRDHLFEPFYTTKPHGTGTGLGLSIVRALVEEAGGQVAATNAPGEGACFEILLPRIDGPGEPAKEEPPGPATSTTILLAEDEDALRSMLQTLLARNGYHVLAASNGRDALDQACSYKGTIDLLLSDVRMPELDGPTLAIALKRSRPSIKTLLISGFLGDTGITLGGEENDWAFMQKPFSMSELLKNIRQTLFVASNKL